MAGCLGWGNSHGTLVTAGKYLLGLYLGWSSTTSAFGAATSLVVLLLWIYYSAQIFLFGAEFTRAYANQFGYQVRPAENAVLLTPLKLARQGLPPMNQIEEAARTDRHPHSDTVSEPRHTKDGS
jgi:membrane protein